MRGRFLHVYVFLYKCYNNALTKTHMLLDVETKQCCCELCGFFVWHFIQLSPQKTSGICTSPSLKHQGTDSFIRGSCVWSWLRNPFFKDVSSSIFFLLRLVALFKLLYPSVIQSDLQKWRHLYSRYQKLDDGNPIPGT